MIFTFTNILSLLLLSINTLKQSPLKSVKKLKYPFKFVNFHKINILQT